MKRKLTVLMTAVALVALTAIGAAAAPQQRGSSANKATELVSDVLEVFVLDEINLTDGLLDAALIEVDIDNLNVLNNSLNNNQILNNLDLDIDIQDVEVLSDNQIQVGDIVINLSDLDLDLDLDDLIGVAILEGGDLLFFVD